MKNNTGQLTRLANTPPFESLEFFPMSLTARRIRRWKDRRPGQQTFDVGQEEGSVAMNRQAIPLGRLLGISISLKKKYISATGTEPRSAAASTAPLWLACQVTQ